MAQSTRRRGARTCMRHRGAGGTRCGGGAANFFESTREVKGWARSQGRKTWDRHCAVDCHCQSQGRKKRKSRKASGVQSTYAQCSRETRRKGCDSTCPDGCMTRQCGCLRRAASACMRGECDAPAAGCRGTRQAAGFRASSAPRPLRQAVALLSQVHRCHDVPRCALNRKGAAFLRQACGMAAARRHGKAVEG